MSAQQHPAVKSPQYVLQYGIPAVGASLTGGGHHCWNSVGVTRCAFRASAGAGVASVGGGLPAMHYVLRPLARRLDAGEVGGRL
jgi:hypothetical protein